MGLKNGSFVVLSCFLVKACFLNSSMDDNGLVVAAAADDDDVVDDGNDDDDDDGIFAPPPLCRPCLSNNGNSNKLCK